MAERWKLIMETNNYFEVSSYGRVRRVRSSKSIYNSKSYIGKIMPQHTNPVYLAVWLCYWKKGERCRFVAYVHRLVAKYFICSCPEGKEVNHKDLDKTNNYYKNLEYVTSKENKAHARAHGHTPEKNRRSYKGEGNPHSKLTFNDIKRIRKIRTRKGLSGAAIGKMFGITDVMVYKIINRDNWGNV